MTRFFKVGDIVDVARPEVQKLVDAFIPNFPEKITSTTGTISSTYRLRTHDNTGWVTVQLAMCPEIYNLQFEAQHLELIIPTELRSLLNEINSRIDAVEHRAGAALTAPFDIEKEKG